MASVNKVILVGNLGQDPSVREANGTVIANFSLATTRKYRDKSQNVVSETEWHRVSFFGRLGEIARDYLQKGSPCYVEGRLRTRKYEKDGVEHYVTEIVGESLQLLGGRDNVQQGQQQSAPQQPVNPNRPTPGYDESSDVPF